MLNWLIDDSLNLEPHIKQLSLQLSKFPAIIFVVVVVVGYPTPSEG